MTDVKLKAQTCQFYTLRGSMIRHRIVLDVWSQRVRERLLREDDLGKVVEICQAAEVTEYCFYPRHFVTARQMSTTIEGATTQSINQCRRTRRTSLIPTSTSVPVVTRHMRLVHVRFLINHAMRAVSRDISHVCADRNRRCDMCHVTNLLIQQSCLLGL